ncbi:hypothetical protein GGTG_05354 [Gaeumannomyces tritici R3-111a-1]|uniref:Protein kinase domain-containing protein n=1 Tax=Gaeumannomyces tritici (strain R3-111a-1) TaxID=644352 RepID=J3NVP1_GAET3|nr:hypothetical protein GGTG_05354 [Gaeumannomyces tritici R3-111a-1]EJT75419.1 hypothetical protein GGTG_05354 [Gaeumannomyces tritici R3-111a-1]
MKTHLLLAIERSSSSGKFLPQSDLEGLISTANVLSILLESEPPERISNPVQSKGLGRKLGRRLGWKLLERLPFKQPERTSPEAAEAEGLSKKIARPTHDNQLKTPGDRQPHNCSGYRKIFAILLLVDRINKRRYFIEAGLELEFVRILGHAGVDAFTEQQRIVCVATLRAPSAEHMPRFDIPTSVTLPWTTCETIYVNHTTVFKIRIYGDYYGFGENKATKDKPEFFALKKFFDPGEFNRQRLLLSHIRKHKHQNIPVASITKGRDHYLVFPWAEMDLLRYRKHQMILNPGDPINSADGASVTQWLTGRHGNI